MKPQLKKALELIKKELSKEDQVKALFTNDKGDVVLNDLKLRGNKVFIHGLEAKEIYNFNQKAEFVFNNNQKADYIFNCNQESKRINNGGQKANKISNDLQIAIYIRNEDQTILKTHDPDVKWDCLSNDQKQELIKKLKSWKLKTSMTWKLN